MKRYDPVISYELRNPRPSMSEGRGLYVKYEDVEDLVREIREAIKNNFGVDAVLDKHGFEVNDD